MHPTAKSRFMTYLRVSCLAASLAVSVSTSHAQKTTAPPPARTYFKDEYGKETKVVKERWGEDENGEKHGKYIRYFEGDMYSTAGQVMESSTYVHGAKTGPAYYIGDLSSAVRYNANKFVGNYINGNPSGVWTVYRRLDGNKVAEKHLYGADGKLLKRSEYKEGKISGTFSYQNNRLSGPARIYGSSEAEYASGSYENDMYAGTWQNAVLLEDGKKQSIKYSKGSKIVFENGVAVTSINSAGAIRSLKAEAGQRAIKKQIVADSIANDERLSLPIQTEGISFYSNSYRLTDNAMYSLDAIANAVNEKLGSRYEVKEIVLSTHTSGINDRDASDIAIANDDTAKFILSLNRAYSIRYYLRSKLKQPVKMYSYPCGSKLSISESDQVRGRNVTYNTEDRVQMVFDESLPNARKLYTTLSNSYNLNVKNEIISNQKLKKKIIKDVAELFQNDAVRAQMVDRQVKRLRGETLSYNSPFNSSISLDMIPPEFWVENTTSSMPVNPAQKEEVKEFKEAFAMLLERLNKMYDTTVEPIAFFTPELADMLKK
ncbi:hypothetical protein [Hymenobacter lapidiphilus]|uniref:hypothetical protein n=1 Tax=Hymenobacter sp. CCM 8763 TaxID=2303334 RepID=UPI0011C10407|nr:hypothetical protein [Hymenobacter sp. CCM 8763]